MCIRAKVEKHRIKVIKKNRKCWIPICTKNSINSHLLQKKGIIDNIAEENHVYQLTYSPYQEPPASLKRIGINEVFTFKGFCSHHDNHIFKSIENGQLNLNDYLTQLLFTYRAVINETRKKEVVIDANNAIIADNSITVDKTELREANHGHNLGIQDSKVLLKELNDEMKNLTQGNFTFRLIQTEEKLPICASGLFTFETTEDMLALREELQTYDFPLNEIYLNVLPFGESTSILIGAKSDASTDCIAFIDNLIGLEEENLKKALSDILIGRMENWIISPTFYQSLSEEDETLGNLYVYTAERLNEAGEIDFNLFDHL